MAASPQSPPSPETPSPTILIVSSRATPVASFVDEDVNWMIDEDETESVVVVNWEDLVDEAQATEGVGLLPYGQVGLVRGIRARPFCHQKFLAFLRLSLSWPTVLENHPSYMIWNMNKRCLVDLKRRGVPTIPTVYLSSGSSLMTLGTLIMQQPLCDSEERKSVIVKPSIPNATSTHALHMAKRFDWPAQESDVREWMRIIQSENESDAMLQPWVPGEMGLVYFDGAFSHAIAMEDEHKNDTTPFIIPPPVEADVRVRLGTQVLEAAAEICGLAGQLPLVARVDVCMTREGVPVLVDLDLIDPPLFLNETTARTWRAAVRKRLAL